MNMQQYQAFTRSTTNQFTRGNIAYLVLGLASETGEVADPLKKAMASGRSWDDLDPAHLQKELGDVLWYVTRLADEHDLTLQDLINANVAKLSARAKEGSLVDRTRRTDPQ